MIRPLAPQPYPFPLPAKTAIHYMTQPASPAFEAALRYITRTVDMPDVDCVTVEDIAAVCHEANRLYCAGIGDFSQPEWFAAPEWQRTSAVNGVKFRLANPESTPADSHASWLAEKAADGWTYGPVKNPELKEHPCFLPYDQLPEDQRLKDRLFIAAVDALKAKLRTEDLYADTADARQSGAAEVADEHSLFRKRYRKLSPDEVKLHDQIKDKADELYALFLKVSNIEAAPDSNRERGANVALAKRHLEDAVYRAVKGLTS